jgi:hypothetical protein
MQQIVGDQVARVLGQRGLGYGLYEVQQGVLANPVHRYSADNFQQRKQTFENEARLKN